MKLRITNYEPTPGRGPSSLLEWPGREGGRRNQLRKSAAILVLAGVLTGLSGCSLIASLFGLSGGYSFSGASIPANATTFSVAYIPNNTAEFPTLSNALTEGLRDRFIRQTRLNMVPEEGDLAFEGDISLAVEAPAAIAAADGNTDAGSVSNRMTITVQMMFTNVLQPELSFANRQTFTAYVDYPVGQRPGIDGQLVEQLVEMLVEDIFNAAVAQW